MIAALKKFLSFVNGRFAPFLINQETIPFPATEAQQFADGFSRWSCRNPGPSIGHRSHLPLLFHFQFHWNGEQFQVSQETYESIQCLAAVGRRALCSSLFD